MVWYVVKLLILLPLIAAMIWGSLKFSQKMQKRFIAKGAGRSVRIVETIMLSPTQKLAVLEFHGREILVATGRNGMTRLAEAPARIRVEDEPEFTETFREGENFAQTLRRINK
jgi:flagellar protein FliO/FliZ